MGQRGDKRGVDPIPDVSPLVAVIGFMMKLATRSKRISTRAISTIDKCWAALLIAAVVRAAVRL